mmetsp:Transcript_3120/g.2593  ORF Transcript_3120/g.2593 Transcript_3120/m.2593 type:complete len:133 (+) Transcript_3120:507-905(+)
MEVIGPKLKKFKIYRISLLKSKASETVNEQNFLKIKEFTQLIQGVSFTHASVDKPLDRAYIFRDNKIDCETDLIYKKLRREFMSKAISKENPDYKQEYKSVSESKKQDVINVIYKPKFLKDLRIVMKDIIIE